ncbi:MAG: methyltransferase domain-containing protein [bacterium]|nr:methyltransferase domain-containing protein [bacterium]
MNPQSASNIESEDRKQLEAEFHSNRETDRLSMSPEEFERKYSNKTFYSICRKTTDHLEEWMRINCPGKTALDYCCGLGASTRRLAKFGAMAYGIDIAEEEVKTATLDAEKAGLADQTNFQVMDAENMDFEDNTFDLIFCSGVLHHLDLDAAYPELARVLKPGGKILCLEALAHNPIIQLYRRLTPKLRTAWETDHILSTEQVQQGYQFFDSIKVNYFYLFSIGVIPFRNTFLFKPLLSFTEVLDSMVLKIPLVRKMAWQMIFELSEPKQDN